MRAGEQVVFHLAFTPQRLQLTGTTATRAPAPPVSRSTCRPAGTSSGEVPPDARVITLTAIAPAGGDVSYVACLQPA